MQDSYYAFEVKRATEDDIPIIHEITHDAFLKYAESAGLDNNIEALRETYDDIRHDIYDKYVFIVKIDDEAVGAVRVKLMGNHEAYLSRFAVAESSRNHGIGKILMRVVDKVMKENEVTTLKLHTSAKVKELVRFYYGRGFYISNVEYSRGYPRAEFIKEYK